MFEYFPGNYTWSAAFHLALMESKEPLTPSMLTQKAKDLGIDSRNFAAVLNAKELDEEIERNKRLGRGLKLNFTPAIIVGDTLFQDGAVLDATKEDIARVRARENNQR